MIGDIYISDLEIDVEAKGIFDEKEFIIRSRTPLVFKIYVNRFHGKVFTSMIELSIYAEGDNIIELIADINYEILFLWVAYVKEHSERPDREEWTQLYIYKNLYQAFLEEAC
jgi:hypothetical protein